MGANIVYFYLGLYHFVVWYLVWKAGPGAEGRDAAAWPAIKAYTSAKLVGRSVPRDWIYRPWPNRREYTSAWEAVFDPYLQLRHAGSMASRFYYDMGKEATDAKSVSGAITAFRKTVQAVLKEEVRRLIWLVSKDAGSRYKDVSWRAIGDGTGTLGFFDRNNAGILFYEYEIALTKPFSVSTPVCWEERSPSFYLYYIGKDGCGKGPPLVVTARGESGAPDQATLQCQHSKGSNVFQEADYARWKHSDGHFEILGGEGSVELEFGAKNSADEMAVMVFSHDLFACAPLPPRLSIGDSRDDNVFVIQQQEWEGYWSDSDVDALLDLLNSAPDSAVRGWGIGWGIGSKRAQDEVGVHDSSVRPAEQQADHGVSAGASDPVNEPLRSFHGKVLWLTTVHGSPELRFTAQGFTSPPRCTWASWSGFTPAKKSALLTDFNGVVEVVDGEPRYNPILSAFRAFAVLEAMILRFEKRATERGLSTVTIEKLSAARAALKVYCEATSISIPVGSPVFVIDSAMFKKYAD